VVRRRRRGGSPGRARHRAHRIDPPRAATEQEGDKRVNLGAISEELSATRPVGQRIRYDGASPFGPALTLHRFTLDTGLSVLIEIDTAAPVGSLQTWVRVGSRFEKQGKTGISHLFEHLMFGETEVNAHGVFDRKMEEAGATTNAATFLDWTYYHEDLPKNAL